MKSKKGITLISLVITIIILIILSSVGIYLAMGNNGIINKAKYAKNETTKQTATEKMNLKITNKQMETYSEEQRMPTLQEFSDELCEDDEIEYVELQSKKVASLEKIEVGERTSIFTKLKEYPYEFEINSSLQLASIDGIKISEDEDNVTISRDQYQDLLNRITSLENRGTEILYDSGFVGTVNSELTLNKEVEQFDMIVVVARRNDVSGADNQYNASTIYLPAYMSDINKTVINISNSTSAYFVGFKMLGRTLTITQVTGLCGIVAVYGINL